MQQFLYAMGLLCLFLNTACVEFEELNSESNKDNSSFFLTTQNISDFIKVSVRPSTEPEKYMVYFSWPGLPENKKLRIRLEQQLALVNYQQKTFSHEVNHNQTLTYNFDILDSQFRIEKSFPKQVKIPLDIVIRKNQNEIYESKKIVANRIYLNEVPLITNGNSIEIIASNLISNNGSIETFPENQKADFNTHGRSGGTIQIKVAAAQGQLKVHLRGENGGDGTKGDSYSSRATEGTPSTEGQLVCDCVGRACINSLKTSKNIFSTVCTCESTGKDAGNGAMGSKGKSGYPAKNGGNTGKLIVSIADGREFDIQILKSEGKAGSPGPGGDGQLGGLGGFGSSHLKRKNCYGKSGTDGPRGPPGDPGDKGQDGLIENACVYISSEEKNDCF